MKDQLIEYQTAELASERGFSATSVKAAWVKAKNNPEPRFYPNMDEVGYMPFGCQYIFRPTQALLQRWLREEHNHHVAVDYYSYDRYYTVNYEFEDKTGCWCSYGEGGRHKSYEEALESGLQKALALI